MNSRLLIAAGALLISGKAWGLVSSSSPALSSLEEAAQRDPASLPDREAAAQAADEDFSGGGFAGFSLTLLTPRGYVDPPEELPARAPDTPAYSFARTTPISGISIYTPQPTAAGKPSETPTAAKKPAKSEPAKSIISPRIIYGALGLSLALTIAGLFFPPLLFLGGMALGVGGLLWFINKKFSTLAG